MHTSTHSQDLGKTADPSRHPGLEPDSVQKETKRALAGQGVLVRIRPRHRVQGDILLRYRGRREHLAFSRSDLSSTVRPGRHEYLCGKCVERSLLPRRSILLDLNSSGGEVIGRRSRRRKKSSQGNPISTQLA